jgi:neural Wiskott-Aldrich syndrome protein
VAETSGFATDLPQSAYLAHTIRRAISAAQQRSHRYVTLEHLLLALLDDTDALGLMEVARTDVAALRVAAAETVNHSLATLYTPGAFDLRASYKVERVLQSASDDARRMGCTEVDGAFVAVALFHETDSPAYELLKRHNFVFHAANGWITRNRGARPAYAPAPPPPPVVEAPPPAPPPAPAPHIPEPAQTSGEHRADDEHEEEILLEDFVIDDAEPARPHSGARAAEPEAVLPPYLREASAKQASSPRPAAPAPAREMEREEPRPRPPVSNRPQAPQRPAPPPRPEAETAPRPEAPPKPGIPAGPDLGSAVPARELPPPPGQEGAVAMGRASPDPGQRQRSEPRTAPEGARTEPRLPVPPAPGRGPGSPVPAGGTLPGRLEGQTEPRFNQPAQDASGGLGSAVPTRDLPSSRPPAEPAEGPPARPHASARERSRAPAPNGAHGYSERREPARPGSAPAQARPEPSLPPAGRLDDMRVRPGPSSPPVPPAPAPAPVPRGSAKKGAARDKDAEKGRRRRPPSPGAVYAGKLAENIPRKMRAFKTETIEVRITREETESVLSGMEGSGGAEPVRHDLLVTQAMSVMLRAPDGGFIIENLGPETQWIFNSPGFSEKEPFGRWRWSVTPNETGQRRLQLVVAARSVDQSGLAGDTALPDQVISVRVRANYGRSIAQAFRWMVLLVLGGVITEGALLLMRILTTKN